MNNIIYENTAERAIVSSVQNVCRLCSSEDNLIDLFNGDSGISDFFRSLILYGTGLEIREDDIVSKMVCQRCCEIAVKLHRYRSNALANDKVLKAQYGISEEQSPNRSVENSLHLSNGHNITDSELDFSLQGSTSGFGNLAGAHKNTTIQSKTVTRVKYKHPSVNKLFKQFPNIVIPSDIFSDHLSPVITLDESEVKDWYEGQLEKMKKKLSHITFKKVTNVERQVNDSCKMENATHISKNTTNHTSGSLLNNHFKIVPTCSKQESSVAVKKSAVLKIHSNCNSSSSGKTRVLPTARKSTTTTKAKQPSPALKRKLSNSSFSDGDNFDDTESFSNLSVHSTGSKSDQPKGKTSSDTLATDKQQTNIVPSSSKIILRSKSAENSKRLGNESMSKQINTDKRKEVERKSKSLSSKISLMADRPKSVEKTSIINSLIDEKREEISFSHPEKKDDPNVTQRARKRTAKHIGTSVTDRKAVNDNVVKKKNKKYYNKDIVTDAKELDLLEHLHSDSNVNTPIPKKSIPDSESLFVLTSGKTLAVFICPVCSLVCDTKRQLVDHEKTHLTCKFCKAKMKNLQLLIEHLNEACIINVRRDDARVRLVRVDDNPSIVRLYKSAFNNDNLSDNESTHEDFNNDDGFSNHDDDFNNDFSAHIKEECDDTLIKHEEVKIEADTEHDIVCVSDNNDPDGVEYSVVQRHTIVPEEEKEIQIDDELKIINRADDNDICLFDAMTRHHSSETEMIKTLFKKYYHGLIKFDKRCQTFRNTNRCVRRTSNNLILLERMLSELTVYIVAVTVESRPNITARFNTPPKPAMRPLEYWGHKKTTCIVKPGKPKPNVVPKVAETKLQSQLPIQIVSVESKASTVNNPTPKILSTTVPPPLAIINSLPQTTSSPSSFHNTFIASSSVPISMSISNVTEPPKTSNVISNSQVSHSSSPTENQNVTTSNIVQLNQVLVVSSNLSQSSNETETQNETNPSCNINDNAPIPD